MKKEIETLQREKDAAVRRAAVYEAESKRRAPTLLSPSKRKSKIKKKAGTANGKGKGKGKGKENVGGSSGGGGGGTLDVALGDAVKPLEAALLRSQAERQELARRLAEEVALRAEREESGRAEARPEVDAIRGTSVLSFESSGW